MQVSSPIAFTPATISQTAAMSRSLGSRHAAPMQKRCEPCALASRRGGEHRVDVHQFLGLEPGVGVRRLRAIAAILRAAAGLDRQQRAKLHLARARDDARCTSAARNTSSVNGRSKSSAISARVQSVRVIVPDILWFGMRKSGS